MEERTTNQPSEIQPLLEKTLAWLEGQLGVGIDKIPFEQYIYALKALRIASKNIAAQSKNLVERVKQDLTLKITVVVDLPRKDPEAFLELYELALEHDPDLASELKNTVTEDIRKLQLQDGSIIGEHVQLAQTLYALNPKDPSAHAAIKHTLRLFERVLKNLREYAPTKLYPYVKSLIQAGLLDEYSSNAVMDSLLVRQGEDGGWGDLVETLYAIRLLVATNILVAGERVRRGLRHAQTKMREDGSLGDLKTTALYVIAQYEYMAAGSLDQSFESSGLMADTPTHTLKQLLAAAIRRAQNSLIALNLRSRQLVEALQAALETTPTLSALLVYSGGVENVPEPFKQPNQRVKVRLAQLGPWSLLIVDRRLIVFTPLDDDALASPKAFAVRVFDPTLAEKLAELLSRIFEPT